MGMADNRKRGGRIPLPLRVLVEVAVVLALVGLAADWFSTGSSGKEPTSTNTEPWPTAGPPDGSPSPSATNATTPATSVKRPDPEKTPGLWSVVARNEPSQGDYILAPSANIDVILEGVVL